MRITNVFLLTVALLCTPLMATTPITESWLSEICSSKNNQRAAHLTQCQTAIQLNANLDPLVMVASAMIGESAESGEIAVFLTKDKHLKKVTMTHFGETGKVSFGYYYEMDKATTLYLISRELVMYDRPIYVEGSSVDSVDQSVYFIKGNLPKGKLNKRGEVKTTADDHETIENAIIAVNKQLKQLPLCLETNTTDSH